MAAYPWMPLYVADYLADSQGLTTEEHGAYDLLIFAYWRRGGPIPDDNKYLANVVKANRQRWAHLRKSVEAYFQIHDGAWHHKRIDIELLKAIGRYNSARANGRAGGLAKSKLTTTTTTDTKKEKKEGRAEVALPDWLPAEVWMAFAEARKTGKHALTPHASKLLLAALAKLRATGDDPKEVLEQSIMNGWRGVFPLKKMNGNGKGLSAHDKGTLGAALFLAEIEREGNGNGAGAAGSGLPANGHGRGQVVDIVPNLLRGPAEFDRPGPTGWVPPLSAKPRE